MSAAELIFDQYADTQAFFAPISFNLIESLVSDYDARRAEIERLANLMQSSENLSLLQYFISGNEPENSRGTMINISNLFNPSGAIAQLNAEYWSRALNMTDVYNYMPQARRDEWNQQIRYPAGLLKRKSRYLQADTEYESHPLPNFTYETARSTLLSLMNMRSTFFAERVDGIFRALSRSHVTNRPEGFSKRMIIPNIISEFGHTDWSTSGVINDLRCVIAKFMGREEPSHNMTTPVIEHIRKFNGEWNDIDGGTLRMRIYNGARTAHLEVHPEIAWRLNAVLASLYPAAIPSQFRQKPKKRKGPPLVELTEKLLPPSVLNIIGNMSHANIPTDCVLRPYHRDPMTLALDSSVDKHMEQQIHTILSAIGGVREKRHWRFSYSPQEVIGDILCSGAIPDYKSHQFYPTPQRIAELAVQSALEDAAPDASWLEPSAGIGNLADEVRKNVAQEQISLVEISELHCSVLSSKGYEHVVCGDFIQYAEHTSDRFDRIVMNPPFSLGRWQAHLEAAASLLAQNGKVVAVLPASARGKILVEGCNHEYTDVLENMFAGTSVSVVIAVITKTQEEFVNGH